MYYAVHILHFHSMWDKMEDDRKTKILKYSHENVEWMDTYISADKRGYYIHVSYSTILMNLWFIFSPSIFLMHSIAFIMDTYEYLILFYLFHYFILHHILHQHILTSNIFQQIINLFSIQKQSFPFPLFFPVFFTKTYSIELESEKAGYPASN